LRERAEEARTGAEGLRDGSAKETMLQIARTYDAMGKRAANRESTQNDPRKGRPIDER